VVADTLDGGLGALATEHVRWFVHRGWDVGLASRGTGSYGGRGVRYEIEIPRSVRQARAMACAARSLKLAIRAFRPDIVHCHGLRSFVVAAAAGSRAAVTLHGSGSVPGEFAGFRVLRGAGVRVAPLLASRAISVAPSDDLGETRIGWEFLPHASPRLKDLSRSPLPEKGPPTFLWLGRLDSQKRTGLFIEALSEAARSRDVRGLIAGAGSEEAALRQLARVRSAPVEFLGFRKDVDALLRRAWAVVLFSRFEGLPLALEEAMWAGRTVITTRLPAAGWLVGTTGFLVDGFEQAVEALLAATDRARAERLGEAAALRARAILSPEMPWPRVEAAYRAICNDGVA
jgi:glycosyltransferase involved in cell wall biosynthesis